MAARIAFLLAVLLPMAFATGATAADQHSLSAKAETELALETADVIPTGNDWIALPSIRAGDAALMDFNVISMRYRGLIEYAGATGQPLIKPFLTVAGVKKPLANLHWSLRDYWLPTGTMQADGLRTRISYVAPTDSRAAIIRLQVTNLGTAPARLAPGMEVNWGRTNRVTYSPEPLTGSRTMSPTPIDSDMEIFNYKTDDTQFAWGFAYVGSQGVLHDASADPGVTAQHEATLAPGETLDVHYLIGVGLEEYSAAYAMRVLNKRIDRYGIDGVIDQAAAEARRHTRTTGRADLDRIMNRNLLFTTYYAWGRALDTEQFVGMTSRSNRYYVSAAYWDRDALLWSFPAILDTDPARAREILNYVFGIQARNVGIHSRFIDGVVLEDGLELDELVAPLVALKSYVEATGDESLLDRFGPQIDAIRERVFALKDQATGLYETFQDAEDEYVQKPFSVYDNVLAWKALNDLAALEERRGRATAANDLRARAAALKAAILKYGVRSGAEGAGAPIFAATVSATAADFMDVPPGSLLKLPYLGFISEDDPLFVRTYDWLHSAHYPFSYADKPWGLPGSYRLPFTTSWSVADHFRLKAGRAKAFKVLTESVWDGGIITEGVKPETGQPDQAGRAFATAAGYVAHVICAQFCTDREPVRPRGSRRITK
ncbi:MAG TPA: glycoside hydrolase family 125 protein [Sphingomicrobium sp.]|nr:glycoside hydrolase family 125 protein [Sphingomicrobium sp.]